MEREPTTWIKLDRNILEWGWYKDPNTKAVFLHLLLSANVEDRVFKGETIHRGELATSIGNIAESVGITYDQARTALKHLKCTTEITSRTKPKYLVITVVNYNKYQGRPTKTPSKSQANPKQIPTTKEYKNKEYKNTLSLTLSHKPYHIPSVEEVREYERESGLGKDPDAFYKHYEKEGWKANGKKIYSWQRLYQNWQEPEKPVAKDRPKRITDSDGIIYELVNGSYEKVRG